MFLLAATDMEMINLDCAIEHVFRSCVCENSSYPNPQMRGRMGAGVFLVGNEGEHKLFWPR